MSPSSVIYPDLVSLQRRGNKARRERRVKGVVVGDARSDVDGSVAFTKYCFTRKDLAITGETLNNSSHLNSHRRLFL